jgi:hypothetical protein
LKIVPGSEFDDSLLAIVERNCERALPNVPLRTHVVPDIPVEPGGKLRVVVVEN